MNNYFRIRALLGFSLVVFEVGLIGLTGVEILRGTITLWNRGRRSWEPLDYD